MAITEIIASVLLCLGAFFALTGGVGVLRMPDFYARVHPAGKNDTLGQLLMLLGLMFLVEWYVPGSWQDAHEHIFKAMQAESPDADPATISVGFVAQFYECVLINLDHKGWLAGAKLVFIILFLFITAPTATHAITKAAHLDGLKPILDPDQLQPDLKFEELSPQGPETPDTAFDPSQPGVRTPGTAFDPASPRHAGASGADGNGDAGGDSANAKDEDGKDGA